MSQILEGNGNGNGQSANGLLQLVPKLLTAPASTPFLGVKESWIAFQTQDGLKLRGVPLRITRQRVVFEVYSPAATPQVSDAVDKFAIIFQTRAIYSGHAVISNVVDAGTKIVCEATLNEVEWANLNQIQALQNEGGIVSEFESFLEEWQKFYTVSSEFKIAVADMQTFLKDLRLWLEQTELKLQMQSTFDGRASERIVLDTLPKLIVPILTSLFENFEALVAATGSESEAASISYAKRMLLPSVLCAPFMRRTFEKPLGYAGDYEMVNMMVRDPFEGDSLFAKILNTFFLNTPPVVAHRNRIDILTNRLHIEMLRAKATGRTVRVFNLGCGPAIEVQRFLADSLLSDNVEFTLVDFDDETVEYTRQTLETACRKCDSDCMIRTIKKSVAQLMRDDSMFERGAHDIVYCAGLFDYLPEAVCNKLMKLFYELAVQGGLVLVSNVHINNPSRGWMEYMVDWHLIYRDAVQMHKICPRHVPQEQIRISIEPTGVNIFAEIRKPENA